LPEHDGPPGPLNLSLRRRVGVGRPAVVDKSEARLLSEYRRKPDERPAERTIHGWIAGCRDQALAQAGNPVKVRGQLLERTLEHTTQRIVNGIRLRSRDPWQQLAGQRHSRGQQHLTSSW